MFRKGGESVCILADNVRKIHTTFSDGSELVEEYDSSRQQLLVRKRRYSRTMGGVNSWEVLMGDVRQTQTSADAGGAGLLMTEGSSSPRCVRVDTPGCFTWTINNLPYPPDTYHVTADMSTTSLLVATSNKKYYKRLALPEMTLLQLLLDPSRLSWSHQGSILTVHYSKPAALLAEELADVWDAMSMRHRRGLEIAGSNEGCTLKAALSNFLHSLEAF